MATYASETEVPAADLHPMVGLTSTDLCRAGYYRWLDVVAGDLAA